MNISRFFAIAGALSLLGGCSPRVGHNPNPVAYKPRNPNNVCVKVSLSKQQVYVMEGNKPLLVAATCVGTPGTPTPTGTFRAGAKIAKKRSGSYGFYKENGTVRAAQRGKGPEHAYVGYPMPYWVGLDSKPSYGFHEGYVHPGPRTHGCLRLHKNVAPKFYALVKPGTPIHIAHSQPEDLTIGAHVPRPVDYMDPDPHPSILLNDASAFPSPPYPLLVDQPL